MRVPLHNIAPITSGAHSAGEWSSSCSPVPAHHLSACGSREEGRKGSERSSTSHHTGAPERHYPLGAVSRGSPARALWLRILWRSSLEILMRFLRSAEPWSDSTQGWSILLAKEKKTMAWLRTSSCSIPMRSQSVFSWNYFHERIIWGTLHRLDSKSADQTDAGTPH